MNVLLIGESWFTYSVHQKGFDSFQTSEYVEGAGEFIAGLTESGHEVDYIPSHKITACMPATAQELESYDAVVISDVGSNTFLLGEATFKHSQVTDNKLEALRDYVGGGGGLVMVGGYMSFSGIDARARYGHTPLADVLPVRMLDIDDRVEVPQGIKPIVVDSTHAALDGVGGVEWPHVLGYNQVTATKGARVLVDCGADPLLVVGSYEQGRAAAFTSDLAPHWAPPDFVAWKGYRLLWNSLLRWLAQMEPLAASSPATADG